MRKKIEEKIEIPEGTTCTLQKDMLTSKKDSTEISREIKIPNVEIKIDNKILSFTSEKANKKEIKKVKSYIAHIKNIFQGLETPFVYKLEAVNVHFPMNLKKESDHVLITNFLGETIPRKAAILPNAEVEIKGNNITVSSSDRETAGQVAANLEQATRVKGRDPRIFQDGIYITKWPEKIK